jgi:uncharacterized membrane protein AbrB (regulator of aidB expression)
MAIGSRTDTTFVVSVQVIRAFMMLAAAPALAQWISARGEPRVALAEGDRR